MGSSLKNILFFVAIFSLSGCAAQGPTRTEDLTKVHKFNAPVGVSLQVETGGTLFVEGEYVEGEKIEIHEPVEKMIPGSMMIPFPMRIEPGTLKMLRISSGWKYYCGEFDKVAASFPGLGVVISEGDCVGIRISRDGREKEWVVDNSIHNRGMTTIYSSELKKDEYSQYEPVTSNELFSVKSLKRISFDGYYGGQIHFTWSEQTGGNILQREFTFDFDGNPTVVGIKGNNFTVKSADNVSLDYEWIKFN